MQCKFGWFEGRQRQLAPSGGFTFFEFLVVAALVATLAIVVTPSFAAWYVRDRIDTSARTFVASLAYARSEAMRRGARVVMCRVDAERRCLESGSACADGVRDWSCGWAVMVDSRGGPHLLRSQAREADVRTSGSTLDIVFTPPAGQVIGSFRSVEIGPRASLPGRRDDGWRRCIRIAAGGRVHLINGSCAEAA
jgi:type IV fimbrial biogenesis protein FimT